MRIIPVVLACVIAAGTAAGAQDNPQKPSDAREMVPVKVQIVLTRLKGDKKISSLPYQIGVTANDGQRTSLRMGIEVPVMTTVFQGGPQQTPPSWNYRSVGTNIDCRADSVSGGGIKLSITVSDSSIHLESQAGAAAKGPVASEVPAFRTFNATFTVLMRDGQTTQYTSAVDPVNGEVMKIDVTMNVMK